MESKRPGSGDIEETRRGQSPDPARPESTRARLARILGLHPLVAFGMFACDWMLFGGEAASGGIGLTVTIPVALALTVPCLLVQRFSFRDTWGAAAGKALMVGVLTAVPMPLGSPATLIGGVIGLLGPRRKELPEQAS